MKKKRIGSLTGLGIGFVVVLAVIMIVHFYLKFPDEPFYSRIFEGAWRFVVSIVAAGLFYLVFFLVIYAAIKLSGEVFVQEEKDDHLMDSFMELSNPATIICFVAAYVVVFLEL